MFGVSSHVLCSLPVGEVLHLVAGGPVSASSYFQNSIFSISLFWKVQSRMDADQSNYCIAAWYKQPPSSVKTHSHSEDNLKRTTNALTFCLLVLVQTPQKNMHTNLMDSLVTILRVMLPDTSSHPLHVRPLLLVLKQTNVTLFNLNEYINLNSNGCKSVTLWNML